MMRRDSHLAVGVALWGFKSRLLELSLDGESEQQVVIQQTRLDSRRAELALLSTVAWPCD